MQEFLIQSMACGGCASRVVQAVRSVDSQAKIEVDVPTKIVRVETFAGREALASALAKAGYSPT